MAVAFVKSNSAYASGPVTLTGTTEGNLLIIFLSAFGSFSNTTLPAGWTKLNHLGPTGSGFSCIWYKEDIDGGNESVAITNPPSDIGWSIHEVSGVKTSLSFDKETENIDGGVSWSTDVQETEEDGEYVFVSYCQESSVSTQTYNSPATRRTMEASHVHSTGDLIVATAGEFVVTGTDSDWSGNKSIRTVSFYAAPVSSLSPSISPSISPSLSSSISPSISPSVSPSVSLSPSISSSISPSVSHKDNILHLFACPQNLMRIFERHNQSMF